jgi:hypothetical protein
MVKLSVGALGLLFSATGSITAAQTPWRLECPVNLTQAECVKAAGDDFDRAHPGLALRTPEHLVIALDNGRKRLIADAESRLRVIALHPVARFLTVREQHSDGFRWHVVSLQTGALTRIEGYPVFSPEGDFFFAMQGFSLGHATTVVSRLFAATHPVPDLKWRASCEDDPLWGLTAPRWTGPQTLEFVQTGLPDSSAPDGQPNGIVQVKPVRGKWQAQGLMCNVPKKR